ncbi:hypothetical protein BGZ89_005106 [Linnemannia elongata]|nr:hypothetical protein BGZ89_005106 [Linnemannia elongata]
MTPQCRLTAAGILADSSQNFSKVASTPLFTGSLGGGFYAKHEIPSSGTSVGHLESVCMNETAILKAGRKPLANEIQKITTSLPAFGSPPDKTVLMKTLGHLNSLGLWIPNIYNPTLRSDLADPLVNILSNYSPQHIA